MNTLKKVHVYCIVNNLNPQKYGFLVEKYVIKKYLYTKNEARFCNGDFSENGSNIELKISFGGTFHNRFNYVQIRPSHNIDYYIFSAYYLSKENVDDEGELFIFKIPNIDMKNILILYGSYAHGTILKNGVITKETMLYNNNEYALRPVYGSKCWAHLMKFQISDICLFNCKQTSII